MLKRLGRALGPVIHGAPERLDCARTSALLPLHAAGDLPVRRAEAVAQHLHACAHCRALVSEYAASRAWLQAGAQPVFADEFYDRLRADVLRQIRQQQTPAPFFAPRRNLRLAFVAVTVALLCVVGALSWRAHVERQPASGTAQASASDNTPLAPEREPQTPPRPIASPENEQVAARQQRMLNRPRLRGRRTPTEGAPTVLARNTPATAQPADVRGTTTMPGVAPVAADAQVARIEMQTADPNIRIIWLAAQPAADQPDEK